MTQPYIHVRGATTSICRRTVLRKAFLAPWDPMVSWIWDYVLADALRVYRVSHHLTRLVINHHHSTVTPSEPNLPEFTKKLHADATQGLTELLRRRGYDTPGAIWDSRGPHYLRLLDASAQMAHLTYEHINQVKAGLVERPELMPGQQVEYGHWLTEGRVIKRPPVFGKSRPSELLLPAEPPAELALAFDGDLRACVHHMRKMGRERVREIRAQRKRPALGAQKLERLHPFDEPRNDAERGRPVPVFRIGARGEEGAHQREVARTELHAFRNEHADVRRARLQGAYDEAFPYGTYGRRVYHNAPVAPEPHPDALLAQPGLLLHEALEQIDNGTAPAVDVEAVIRAAKETIAERAIEDEEELDFRRADPDEPKPEGERPPPETRHKNDRKHYPRSTDEHPRRLSFRRDGRRGRPKKPPGSDPPSQ